MTAAMIFMAVSFDASVARLRPRRILGMRLAKCVASP
jgi:hypothetical protein